MVKILKKKQAILNTNAMAHILILRFTQIELTQIDYEKRKLPYSIYFYFVSNIHEFM